MSHVTDAPVTDVSGPAPPRADEPRRRDFIHIFAGAMAVGGAAALAWPFIDQWNPAADTLAFASIEYAYTKVPLGQQVAVLWRKQPVFIRHRTPAGTSPAWPSG
jgi:ubiquinol-cytochrome c reductase iron-sulfur subunit